VGPASWPVRAEFRNLPGFPICAVLLLCVIALAALARAESDAATQPQAGGGPLAITRPGVSSEKHPAAKAARCFSFRIIGRDAGSWPDILSSVGFQPGRGAPAIDVIRQDAVGQDASVSPATWLDRAEAGSFLILEGQSALAEATGFHAQEKRVTVRNVVDVHRQQLRIVWERALNLPVFAMPRDARVFASDRWTGAPLVAGIARGSGGILWLAASPGERGYERFPYLLHALADLGCESPFRSRRLWAFFDGSYRARFDPDYFARRWRKAGIAALQVAAWHYYDGGETGARYLRDLIAACHRNGILVYAWIEFPHVSEKFWDEHPEWREKTATLQDAHLDWRKLMNLANPACFQAAAGGTRKLIAGFDWDGVNLGELYFESLEGAGNPSRFTPMNDDVRREFRDVHGFDPHTLFETAVPDAAKLRAFLDYRANIAIRIEAQWIAEIDGLRRERPGLDLVMTHVDDRFDTGMRDLIGADAAAALPLAEQNAMTFLIEDPATVWNLGPRRYPEIAKRYQPLTRDTSRLAIDINVVERYQDVYPTKQQTGIELFQLVRLASDSFARVALYFENSILPEDWPYLGAAGATVTRAETSNGRLTLDARHEAGVRWSGAARVDGRLWPAADGETLWLPAGSHTVEHTTEEPSVRLLDLNAEFKNAWSHPDGVEFEYESGARTLAILDQKPVRTEVDGVTSRVETLDAGAGRYVVMLPPGRHLVRVETEPGIEAARLSHTQ
jgi:hypothetical protein